MTPTLFGRIQTRIFVTIVIGGLWTLIVSPFLPGIGDEADLSDVYKVTFRVVVAMLVLGIVWECIYHVLQGYRWEKDWPSFFGFFNGVNEFIVLWIVIKADLVPDVPSELKFSTFFVHFVTVWIVAWAWLQGPMKILSPRWRFRGGRLI